MENPKREVFYDEATGQLFIAEDIQEKLNELLDIQGTMTLHEMYALIAESLPEGAREQFLEGISHPWSIYDKIGLSFELKPGWIIDLPDAQINEEDSP